MAVGGMFGPSRFLFAATSTHRRSAEGFVNTLALHQRDAIHCWPQSGLVYYETG